MTKVRIWRIEIMGQHSTKCTTETLLFNGITISLENFKKSLHII